MISSNPERPLLSCTLIAVLAAQFLSALADNALLFATLALLKARLYPTWSEPLLQEFFVGAYILLAPFAGPFADALPKGRVMLIANALKLAGAFGILLGLNPFLCYGLVGIGAATYSPAKYGILVELTSSEQLVKANGLMESSTIAAILIGAIAGGTLADASIPAALAGVIGCFALAALANLFIPRLEPAHRLASYSAGALMRDFGQALKRLVRVPEARFSLIGTSIFWGAGSTMRFLLIAWVPVALGITNNRTPAYLNAMVAVGIVVGAALAGKLIPLAKVRRALGGGVLLGLAVCALAFTTRLHAAYALLALVGAAGGFFVVPLNALLQEKGHESVGGGHAIALQNLAENAAMLLMVGLYTLALRAGAPVTSVAAGFGLALTLGIAGLWWQQARGARLPRAAPVAAAALPRTASSQH
ncbi:MAG TPA: lysophospholipid transporter LplT [Steroidobacteraceae bacterium]|nr:lysophospholipid transporter LplT [Steroidobacteraceae bacterium]